MPDRGGWRSGGAASREKVGDEASGDRGCPVTAVGPAASTPPGSMGRFSWRREARLMRRGDSGGCAESCIDRGLLSSGRLGKSSVGLSWGVARVVGTLKSGMLRGRTRLSV